MDKSLGHFCTSGAFSNSHRSNPSPHTKCVDTCIRNVFRVSALYRVRGGGGGGAGGRTATNFRKGCTVLRGNREMTEIYEFCRTLVKIRNKVKLTVCK